MTRRSLAVVLVAVALSCGALAAGARAQDAGAEARSPDAAPGAPEAIAEPPVDDGAVAAEAPVGEVGPSAAQPAPPPAAPRSLASLKARAVEQDWRGRMMGVFGILAMLGVAFALSLDRRRVDWRLVGMGTALQLAFALLVLKTAAGRKVFEVANDAVTKLLSFSTEGARFLFGNLVDPNVPVGAPLSTPASFAQLAEPQLWANTGALFAFRVLPTILLFSALTAVLYHLGVLQLVVRGIAWIMRRTMRTSGAESLAASANIFVGQTEAPLLVRPFLDRMTRSELMCVMTGGFATVAGGVLAAFVGMLSGFFPDIAGHLLAASVMSAPAALVMAKIMVPETEVPLTATGAKVDTGALDANVVDAATRGTSEGLSLALNVGAMLIAFIALIAMLNAGVSVVGDLVGVEDLTLQRIFGWLGAPIAYLLGTPWEDAAEIGMLIGTKTAVNEFVAYAQLVGLLQEGRIEHAKSVVIAVYALCGFSNFSSIGIQIGGLSALAPARRPDLARLGLRAMLAGSLACFQTAAIAALVL